MAISSINTALVLDRQPRIAEPAKHRAVNMVVRHTDRQLLTPSAALRRNNGRNNRRDNLLAGPICESETVTIFY